MAPINSLWSSVLKKAGISLAFLLVFFWTAASFSATDESRLRCRAHDFPGETVWVGQQVDFYVSLFLSGRPKGSPRFTIPDVPGGILLLSSGSPVYGNETLDGMAFTTWSYSFAFYPQRAGQHEIPPISATAGLPDGKGGFTDLTVKTKAFRVSSRLPEDAKGLKTLISTTDMDAVETWEPDLTDVNVGDAVTRSVTLKAPKVMSMGFPPLDFGRLKGVSVYPKQAQVNDSMNRGEINGERVETVVYVFEEKGRITLPAMDIPWFDLDDETLKKITLPGRKFKVSRNPAYSGSGPGSLSSGKKFIYKRIFTAVLVLGVPMLCLILYRRFKQPLMAYRTKRKARIEAGEPYLYSRLRSAIRSGDSGAVINQASPWIQAACKTRKIRTLTGFAERYGDAAFKRAVADLMKGFFGPEDDREAMDSSKSGPLSRGLAHARKRCLGKEKTANGDLPPLNPGGAVYITRE